MRRMPALLALVALFLTGCGGSKEASPTPVVTETVTVEPTTQLPSPEPKSLSPDDLRRDTLYRSLKRYPRFAATDPETLEAAAESGCSGADRGAGFEALHSTAITLFDVTPEAASALIGSMLALYCPEHQDLLEN